MASELSPFSIVGPGALGLNTKLAGLEIGPQFCVSARNCAISNEGTVTSRKGWDSFEGSSQVAGGAPVRTVHEYIDSGSTSRMIWTTGNRIFENAITSDDVTGSITAPTEDNWKFVNFNGKCIGVQDAHKPIVKVDGGDFSEISFDSAPVDPVDALAAWGRVWYVEADRETIKYSDLLQEGVLTSGSAGTLNMYTVWTNGYDEIVSLQEFNNSLVIFGRRQIVIYGGADDPNNSLQLIDVVNNTGCIARDSIQNIGNDILFLGNEGVISFSRNVEAGGDVRSLPLANLSDNVSTFLSQFSSSEPRGNIKSAFKEDDGFYLLAFPASNITFYFNIRYPTEQSKARIFIWSGIDPTGLGTDRDNTLYIGRDGYLGRYTGYRDKGKSYNMNFKTGWVSGEGPVSAKTKIFKQASMTIKGGYNSSVTFSWSFNFDPSTYDADVSPASTQTQPSEYGIAEYGTGNYSRTSSVKQILYRMSGSGKSLQFGISTEIDGAEITIQEVTVYLKNGKLSSRGRI